MTLPTRLYRGRYRDRTPVGARTHFATDIAAPNFGTLRSSIAMSTQGPTLRQLQRSTRRLRKRFRRTYTGARNAVRLVRGGRFTPPYETPYALRLRQGFLRLRHYPLADAEKHVTATKAPDPVLLVPPLMVTSQVYDISPPMSVVKFLRDQGLDVWLADFGAPEAETDGMGRTLDDHILAIDASIQHIVETTGRPVHLAGYSQGGMFVYQVAAYRGCADIRSLITFGSPVDLQKNTPTEINRNLIANVTGAVRSLADGALHALPGIPGIFSSLGFKLMSPTQEIRYLRMMLGILDDREALERLEPMRRFLGGEGFVAWPGPAFRTFVDDMIVHNRMMSGGLVVGGKTVSLAAINIPVLAFYGARDQFAQPRAVRAIARVVGAEASVYEQMVDAGHFGLVVGSRAVQEVWPNVVRWVLWHADRGPAPVNIVEAKPAGHSAVRTYPTAPVQRPTDSLDTVTHEVLSGLWNVAGVAMRDVTQSARWLRWQVPRLANLLHRRKGTTIAAILDDLAARDPNRTFFLFEGRAYSRLEANVRVNQLLDVLLRQGLGPGDRVGLMMENHPDYLTALTAINRMGGVAVLLNPSARGRVLEHALNVGRVRFLLATATQAAVARKVFEHTKLMVVGRGTEQTDGLSELNTAINPDIREPPQLPSHTTGPDDLALLIFTSGTTGLPKAAKITNRRWLLAATLAATAGSLTPADTVYCCLPLYHATGLLLGVGGALIGESRLVLARKFSASRFWADVRRHGVTVVFYVGELLRYLTSMPETANEKTHPVRLFFGNGLRAPVWRDVLRRFGRVQILEFYASTEGNVMLANLTGEKVGSVGRAPLPILDVELVRYNPETAELERGPDGMAIACEDGEPGLMIVQIHPLNPFSRFDGYTDAKATAAKILNNVFRVGDAWFSTGDMLHRDADGDFWFVDRLGDTFRWKGENVSTQEVAEVLREAKGIADIAVYGVEVVGHEGRAGMAAVVLAPGQKELDTEALRAACEPLPDAAWPRYVRVVEKLEYTSSFKVIKHQLQRQGIADVPDLYTLNPATGEYVRATTSHAKNPT